MQEVEKTSILKIDFPIGKLKFFVNSLILLAVQLLVIGTYLGFYFYFKSPTAFIVLLIVFGVLFFLPLVYLNFVNYAKRLWDITGERKTSIIITAVIFILSLIGIFLPLSFIIWLGIYFAMIFTPGKLVK